MLCAKLRKVVEECAGELKEFESRRDGEVGDPERQSLGELLVRLKAI